MRKLILTVALAASAAGSCAFAKDVVGEEFRPSVKEQLGELADANTPAGRAEARMEVKLAAQAARELNDVGDADSFGRNVRWLGFVSSPLIMLRQDCSLLPGEDPARLCMTVSPYDQATRYAEFRDVARITLPPRSAHSMLCHWFTPSVQVTFANYTGFDNRTARMTLGPSLTVENEALNDPALVDPDSGEPLNGKMEIGISSAILSSLLDNGETTQQRLTSTRTCVGGYVNKRALVEVYGLSEKQARQFFRNATTVRLNLTVSANGVQDGGAAQAIRFVGD